MQNAPLYRSSNHHQRSDAKKMLEHYHLNWRAGGEGGDTLLDVGCGTGDVLMDFIKPLLPTNFSLILGTDILPEMVEYASQQYHGDDERVKFRVLDIGTDELPSELCERFDHVTSFYCLQFLQDQKKTLSNIHRLLRKSGGDCFLVYIASHPFFEIYIDLSKKPRWAPYMTDIKNFVPPFQFSENPAEEVKNILSDIGYIDFNVDLRTSKHYYTTEVLKECFKSVCPFVHRISEKDLPDFLQEPVDWMKAKNFYELNDKKELKFFSNCKLIVAYARKADSQLN